MSIVFSIAQFALLGFVNDIVKQKVDKSKLLSRLRSLTKVISWFSVALLSAIIFQILVLSHYYVQFIIVGSSVSWGTAAFIMILLGVKLLNWYKANKSWILLLYAVSSISLAAYEVSMICLASIILIPKDPFIFQNSDVVFPINDVPGSPIAISNSVVQITYNLSFVLFWGSTALFLYGHVRKLGKWKYWSIMVLILVSFLSYLGFVFPELELPQELQEAELDIVPGILFSTYSAIAGAFLFGIGFLLLSREFRSRRELSDHMISAAIGFFILFISNGATIFEAAYPPFGLVNVLIVPLASYLVFHGIYYSTISLSKDNQLRRSVKKSILTESSFIEKMGEAEMEISIQDAVRGALERNVLSEDQEIEPSLTKENLKSYMNEVLREIKRKRGDKHLPH
jgi:hypothetical protein